MQCLIVVVMDARINLRLNTCIIMAFVSPYRTYILVGGGGVAGGDRNIVISRLRGGMEAIPLSITYQSLIAYDKHYVHYNFQYRDSAQVLLCIVRHCSPPMILWLLTNPLQLQARGT